MLYLISQTRSLNDKKKLVLISENIHFLDISLHNKIFIEKRKCMICFRVLRKKHFLCTGL